MADSADIAAGIVEDIIVDAARRAAAPIAVGTAGECNGCEWWMPRLVDGLCGFCRDGRRRPPDWQPPTPPTTQEAAPPIREKTTMPAKSIQLPASEPLAIESVEARAKTLGASIGVAAADLIIAGAQTIDREAGTDASLTPFQRAWFNHGGTLDSFFAALIARAEQPDLSTELAAVSARADAAEAQLARIKAAFG